MSENRRINASTKKVVASALAAILVVAGIACAVMSQRTDQVQVTVDCPGWNADTSTPIVLSIYEGDVKDRLTSTEEDAEAPEPLATVEMKSGEATDIEAIEEAGTYTLAVVGSPVLEDGTIFDLPEPQVVEYDGKTGQKLSFTLTAKAAEDVTEADIAAATEAATIAGVDSGKVTANTNNTRSSASSAQGGTIEKGQTTAQSKPSGGNSTPSNSGSANSGNSGSNGGSSNSGNSGSNGSSQSHTHSWVAQTKTVHHDAVYKTVHHDAVYKYQDVCVTCGAINPDLAHSKNHALNGESDQVREQRVCVQEAYDEKVLVSNAYDETVTTGYKCSGCGATK